jgi:predicted small lipoprotein YifL
MRAVPALALALLALAGCGQRAELAPPPGKSLPVAPYGRDDRPDAEELLALPPQAAPERITELRRRSEERRDDPFDLPPEE